MSRPACVMLVAGEASGDALGAELARALRSRLGTSQVRFVGVGGVRMAAEGIESPFDIAQLSVFGLVEGLLAYPRVVARVRDAVALAARERPDIAVLIDSWGFTLRVAHGLRRLDPAMTLVKYVAPQVWASRPGRAKTLARAVDHLMTIHSFDAPLFEREGLQTSFVGNPTLARETPLAQPARLRAAIGARPDDPILLLAPGSRPSEIERMMPPFEDAAARLMAERPTLRVVIPAAPTVAAAIRARLEAWPHPPIVIEDEALKADAMRAASVALACSGTVTTELAMAGCPMVVAYRLSPVTHALAKVLIRTPFIVLINVAAGEMIVPELIQHDCNGPALARALAERLDDPALSARQVAAQDAALVRMGRGGPDPSEKAAEVVAGLLEARLARPGSR
jgi:lipid-A-disaccharide synthase